MREKRIARKKRILILLIIVCVAVFGFCAYMLINYYLQGERSESAFAELRLDENAVSGQQESPRGGYRYSDRLKHYRGLYEKNHDFAGWIRVYGTAVSYPVMQTPDDRDFYLHRDFDKEYSAAGALFASDISDIEKPSDLTIIYGHMMKNGSMFGGLKAYSEPDYINENGRAFIRFDTLGEERYYRIFCVFTTAVNTGKDSEFKYYEASDFGSKEEFEAFISAAKKEELYDTGVSAEYGDGLLALSTCEYTHKDGRLVLLAKRVSFEEMDSEANGQ
jgi:sortase B